ncbi:sugar-binding domain-containing protein [Arenibacter sp. ARW7G5Y1]|uniref:sugar-binding domain-containing protein n=1 Tax=Arenibacter sp. ARW7G5Y1 TaxID=2135619 RepID=UPI000D76FAAA|nr:sugar-binding domain-containing protein [Arenibacter sp. ARW7G5Y1]PXX21709.1 glycosyl hydrolase family 2 [Arenibacter sp. ARW7G5Y1]
MKHILIIFFLLLGVCHCMAQNEDLDLSGEWEIWLDKNDSDFNDFAFDKKKKEKIDLPATLDEAGIGYKTTKADVGRLSRKYKYYGAAWYQREITIPTALGGKEFEVFLERVMWKSDLWIDGDYIGSAVSLGTPHKFVLGKLTAGKHTLTLKINNKMIYNIGDVGHAYTDFNQTKWNGVLGAMKLIPNDGLQIKNLQTFPNLKKNNIDFQFKLKNEFKEKTEVILTATLTELVTGNIIDKKESIVVVHEIDSTKNQSLTWKITIPIKAWSSFDPFLYKFSLQASKANFKDKKEKVIGFRDITISKTKIIVNNTPIFIRGNLNNTEFPLTGYPPTDVSAWERIFKIHKDYGLNHVRFHSWCPPEAAFIAADKVGILLQVETLWIAQWMRIEGRAFTPARPLPLGEDPEVNKYIEEELNRIIEAYGNHPSFAFLCVGNELDNGDYNIIQKWLDKLKIKDGDRRLYSLSASWNHAWNDQYKVTGEPYNRFFRNLLDFEKEDLGYPRFIKAPNTNWDYEELDSRSPVPLIAHEIGQQAMYPLWSEIEKYTGTLAPRNYISFMEKAKKNGVYELNKEMSQASGKLAQLLYKNEIEGMLRTPSCAGFELLGMQDFPGQGEALVGWLDAFYDSKGVTDPEEFTQHCDTTVVLMRTNSFIYTNNENLRAKMQVHHFGASDIKGKLYWKLSTGSSTIMDGNLAEKSIPQASITDIDSLTISLNRIKEASKVKLEVGITNSDIKNTWDFWVYPENSGSLTNADIYITSVFDSATKERLQKGEKVVLVANELGDKESMLQVSFDPLYWSLSWIPNQATHTLGTYVRDKHPAMAKFPTDIFTGMQWKSISEGANSFYLDKLAKKYQPIVQPIYDFHFSRKVGSIFELKVGKGKLLVCGYNILDTEKVVARQLKKSLMEYVASEDFNPNYKVSENLLDGMFNQTASAGTNKE